MRKKINVYAAIVAFCYGTCTLIEISSFVLAGSLLDQITRNRSWKIFVLSLAMIAISSTALSLIDYNIYSPPVFLVLGILVRIGFESYILWKYKFNINRLCTLLSYAMLIVVFLFSPSVTEEKHIKNFKLICFIGSGLLFLGNIENIKIYLNP